MFKANDSEILRMIICCMTSPYLVKAVEQIAQASPL